MTSLLALRKPTYPQSFMLIYGFLFELWVLNLKEEKKKKMKNSAHHSPIHLEEDLGHPYIQSTTVLCDTRCRAQETRAEGTLGCRVLSVHV